jgi:hypothetical protein
MFVHLSEYVTLRTMAAGFDHVRIGFERSVDKSSGRAMDLTIEVGERLIAYVEVKTGMRQAKSLVREFTSAIASPIRIRPLAKATRTTKFSDGEKKADYILQAARGGLASVGSLGAQQILFGVRASGDGNDANDAIVESSILLDLDPNARTIVPVGSTASFEKLEKPEQPLALWVEQLLAPERTLQAKVAWTLERRFPELWLARSVKEKGLNLYIGTETGDHILLGFMADGRIYSAPAALGPSGKDLLAAVLGRSGFSLGTGEAWTYWRNAEGALRLDDRVAEQILERIVPGLLSKKRQ